MWVSITPSTKSFTIPSRKLASAAYLARSASQPSTIALVIGGGGSEEKSPAGDTAE